MRRVFTILLCGISLFAAAQKIALIEPRTGEGSTVISGMEKAMVRGELRKAIVNHTGFEAFTRADIDQLMKEQDFQRTGNVSKDDIHKMGEMSGADYLCISTLNKSDNEFYLEAYLINVETGAISNPASQYGELVNGKLANMLPVCQALAQELLGTNTPIAQPVITRPTTPKPEPIPAPSYSANTQSQAQQNEAPNGANGIGELKTFSDGSKGVVFYLTEDGQHGLVVSLDEAELKWENEAKEFKCHDIMSLQNEENPSKYITFKAGLRNTTAIIQQLGEVQAPAAGWCVRHGEGWYLPSAGELWYLFAKANGGDTPIPSHIKGVHASRMRESLFTNGAVNTGLRAAGGVPLKDEDYWSSTEKDFDDVCTVDAQGDFSSSEKPDTEYVRAVRAF